MNRSVRLVLTALLLFSAAAALPARAQDEPAALNVVATFSVLGDFVAQVGGERVNLTTLVPAGGDPHTFEPSPADSVALADADLIFEIGLGFESWLDDMVSASGTQARRVVLTEGLDLLPAAPHEGEDEDHADEEFDPHVWLDPQRVMAMIATIQDALIEADPAGEDSYRLNAENYVRELEMLDAELEAAFGLVPEASRQLITSHEAFAYLGERYGFTVDSVLGITTESADPPAAALAAIIDRIRASGVPAVFPETAVNPSLIEQIAADADVSVGQPLFDVLGEPGSDGETYLAMMRHNALAIVSALAPAQ